MADGNLAFCSVNDAPFSVSEIISTIRQGISTYRQKNDNEKEEAYINWNLQLRHLKRSALSTDIFYILEFQDMEIRRHHE
ncbi:hypothetical protein ACT7CZ_27980 [Bacillus cereus]